MKFTLSHWNKRISDTENRRMSRWTVPLMVIALLPVASGAHSTETDATDETATFGFSEPFRSIEVAASETGILERLQVKPGDSVTAGQELGNLDSDVLAARAEMTTAKIEAKARLKATRIRLQRASNTCEKLRSLYEEGHGGSRELELAESDFELAETELTAVEEEQAVNRLELKRIKAELRRRQITSPIDGIVSEIHRDVGEFVASTTPNVMTIVNLKQLRVRFYPSADEATEFHKGRQVKVRFVHSQKIASAEIDFVSPVINADSNTIRVEVLIDNQHGQFRSGRRCLLLSDTDRDPTAQTALRPRRPGLSGGLR